MDTPLFKSHSNVSSLLLPILSKTYIRGGYHYGEDSETRPVMHIRAFKNGIEPLHLARMFRHFGQESETYRCY